MLGQPGLRRFVLLPALGNIVLFALAAGVALWGLESALDAWLPDQASWLRWLLFPVLILALLVGTLFAFTVLANLLLGPFLGLLAAKVNERLGGPAPPPGAGFLPDLARDTGLELRRLGYILLCTAGVLLLGLVPVVNLVAAPLGLLLTAWLLAMEHAAHALGLRRMSLSEQLGFLRLNRLGVMGFGFASMGVLLVPLLNLVLLPAAVCGMTLFVHERLPRTPDPE
ncbi:sulfate transporter CysZ [Lysobacter sp. CAU 1642]|uniref:Sulfate transporter CysZ n=2 Tax=Pseudomarimonas salicorniae TaxID=2933270 RepID=A0ABT0GH12_9GAMM|nr:sulfate transporter CysZ [Lysobacter sp. CAU 1642]